MPIFHLLVLSCPPPDDVLFWYRLQELCLALGVPFLGTLLVIALIVVGAQSARELSR